jgi:hypothetical protein
MFEEVLGLIDLAAIRGEALRGIPLSAIEGGGLSLSAVRRSLVLLMADAIRRKVPHEPVQHARLVRNLRAGDRLNQTSFITTNYDTLIDSAIEGEALPPGSRGPGSIVEYGFGGLEKRVRLPGREMRSFPLYKVHGSLNWLHCPVCTDLVVTHGADIVGLLLDDPPRARCTHCDGLREPVIVPPTLYKSLSNVYLAVVWNRAASALRDCVELVFCGYSLPDADMHVKYLVKSAQLNRGVATDPIRITLVNNFPTKPESDSQQELERYVRLFGPDAVSDSHLSFEAFAGDPGTILGRPRHNDLSSQDLGLGCQ